MQSIPQRKTPITPWYREPWPWLLMSGPATVIVAGIYTSVLAFSGTDGLVADDYYKQGLAMNKTLLVVVVGHQAVGAAECQHGGVDAGHDHRCRARRQ